MGEKQRITLARALLKNPPVLVLDEATASVDVETERFIQNALERLILGSTTLIIAHRLSTIRNADQIILNIANSGFDFKELNVEIERYNIDSTNGNSNEQYIPFANYTFNV